MPIELSEDVLQFLEEFIYYSELDMMIIADAMCYDYDGFRHRLNQLRKALEAGKSN